MENQLMPPRKGSTSSPSNTVQSLVRHIKSLEAKEAARDRMQLALRESEEKYRTLTENIDVGIFRSTPGPKGKFLEINPALVRMLGYQKKNQLLAKPVADIYVYPKERERLSRKISSRGFVHHEEVLFRKKDGSTILASMTARAVRNDAGKILYFDGIVEDITVRKRAEEELLLQKTYLEILFKSAPEAIALHGPDDLIININEEFTRMFGYTRNDAIGKPINDLVVSREHREEAARISRLVLNGRSIEIDSKRMRKDGSLVDVSILGAPIVHQGKVIGDYAIYRDITERKKAEEQLYVQTSYLERLFNSAPEAIVLHDNNDRIVNVNDEFTRMFGFTREESVGRLINELVASEDKLAEAAMLSNKVIHGQRVELDTQRRRKDGTLFDVSILGAPIFYGGNQMGVFAVYRDISSRKKAEQDLTIQETFFTKLFNSAPEAIILHDNNDVVVDVNEEFSRMFGYSRQEAIGKPINDLVASPQYRGEADRLSSAVIHGQRVELDSRRRRKDGSLIDVSILGAPVIHQGKQLGIYAIYRDITERKRAEDARIRAQEEARMARNIQINLLPKTSPDLQGYDIAGRNVPASHVGGDYFDFIRLDENRIAIGIGDVSGKGLAASLVMANLQATIRSLALFDADPKDCLERANKLLFRSTDARTFVSLFYGILDGKRGTLRYANAGQSMPVLFRAIENPSHLSIRGIALGVKEDAQYEEEEVPVAVGDKILIYTDGISEAMNASMQEFGEERLQTIVTESRTTSSIALIEEILAEVNAYVQDGSRNDDMTVVVMKRLR